MNQERDFSIRTRTMNAPFLAARDSRSERFDYEQVRGMEKLETSLASAHSAPLVRPVCGRGNDCEACYGVARKTTSVAVARQGLTITVMLRDVPGRWLSRNSERCIVDDASAFFRGVRRL